MRAFGRPTDKLGALSQDELADAIIRDCGDDPRTAVVAMLKINSALLLELQTLTGMRAADAPISQDAFHLGISTAGKGLGRLC